jgi:hypothetical protein
MKKVGLLVAAVIILAGLASAQTTIFSDNMTSLTGWTLSPTTGGWTTTTTKYYSSSYSARCDDVSPYANNQNNYMTKTVSLSGYTGVTLKFYIWQYSESGYDYLRVQYLVGSTWTTAWQRAGSYQAWAQQSVSIPSTATQIRFYFNSDASVTNTGVYIDDVVLTGTAGTTDTQAPTVSVTAPINGATVSGTTTVTASASDNVGVSKVDFYVDGVLKGTDTSSPYSYSWVTTSYANGSHTVYAKAYDAANNVGTSATNTVTVSNSVSSTAEWTIMVYLNADNNLETDGINDFLEMAAASYSSGKINVIVQMDRASGYATTYENWTGCKRFKIASGMTPTAAYQISDLGEVDMGSPTTLVNFATWAIQNYPANRYSLVMWDHGDGWYKTDASPIKGFSNDDSHGSVIGIANGEFASAMAQIKTALGRNLDHIGWDACLMGMWEVLDISRNYANVANVSEETEGAAGWYYTTWLNVMNTTPTTSAIDMGKAIINGTTQSTLSVVDLTLISDLTTKVNTLATELMAARGAGLGASISTALTNTLKFSTSYFSYHIDLSDFAAKVKAAITTRPTLTTACDNVISAVTSAVKLYKNSSTYANARGIAVYHCKIDGSNYNTAYNSLPIASSTVWDEYIKGGSSGGTTANYTKSTATYSWDASATTATGLTGDDQSVSKSIGFAFNFYGTSYTTVNICSNGFLNFGTSSTAYSPATIPNTAAPNALIAGLWRDLNVSGGGTITYYSSATKFVVSFNAVKNYSNTSLQTFQMILTPDGKIKIQWGGITTETYASGVENQGGTLGVAATAAANSAALFTPPAAWSSPINENELETRLNPQGMPLSNQLFQNAPNPVRYKTLIAFQLEKPGAVSLKIYNLNGQLVRTLASGQHNSGYHQAMWDAKDDAGRKVADGVYIYKLASGEFNHAKKMVLVK